MLGTGGDEVSLIVCWIRCMPRRLHVLQRAMHIHPTVSEYVPFLLEN